MEVMRFKNWFRYVVDGCKRLLKAGWQQLFPNLAERTLGFRIRYFVSVGLLIALTLPATAIARWHIRSAQQTRLCDQLNAYGIEYTWACDEVKFKSNAWQKRYQQFASNFGRAYWSEIVSLKISHRHLTNKELMFLKQLPNLKRLELETPFADDQVLAWIAELRDLEELTVIGPRFTVHGLLQLRKNPALRQVAFYSHWLKPIEVAVVQTELPGASSLRAYERPRITVAERPTPTRTFVESTNART